MLVASFWVVPIFSSICWMAMLITMLAYWSAKGHPHYPTMDPGGNGVQRQTIAYISDIGAQELKPMFIAMSAVTVVTFDLAFIFERYLRHAGKLAPNTSVWQKIYSLISMLAAIVGAVGLILLTIFDNYHHNRMHNICLAIFIIGYIVSAIFICWEYQRLGIHYRQHSILRISFWIKLAFIITEICLCIIFGVTQLYDYWNVAAVFEWIIAFVYTWYVLSFFIDFLPAVRTKNHQSFQTEMQMAEEGGPQPRTMGDGAADSQQYFRGAPMTAGEPGQNFYPNASGYNNHAKPEAPIPSRNF
ncbi:Frag1/DRAM/Sfk1 family-domain-containing protein [Boeremia exigua]|uniref:Frag1/DRAM/Sfk1 family-domain-containing protein n=1 Tax=Boeremia exigua TaxID=749465 RepID=UPI001E8DC8DF|nr:Frag1/DRAM/Sfk1 family-domain-containing protein [Boeremia exigua]KAH6612449.1 Frag1/DRAM/Sfk1 family-domain-containing protein [Boeremia exigua]